MRFSRDWLGDFVELPDDTAELARRLTAAGLAVDTVEKTADGDSVLDIDVTTNRVDAMNHLGLAREIAVLYGLPLREPAAAVPEGGEETTAAVRVAIDDPELCSRYAARVVRGVAVGPSPDWLARRLSAIGQRPINNVVDATNYVLWELGQPLHGFDLAQIAGAEIRVRRARAGETLVTLDGEERKLTPEMLVIADSKHSVALAGVMGGERSEVGPGTTDVLLESAWFDPRSVRATAKALGMHTDASHRFERGADPELQARAAARAAALVAEAGGGTVLAGAVDVRAPDHAERHRAPAIDLDLDRLDAFGGVAIPADKPVAWLRGLGFTVEATGERKLRVTVPSWRLSDVTEAADLYEEVLRVHGYDAIPSTLPALGEPDAPPTPRQLLRDRVREVLAGAGYAEAVTWAFQSPAEAESMAPLGSTPEGGAGAEEPVLLDNPVSELYSTLRRSLLPGLVADARYNTRRGAESVRLFELGVAFGRRPGEEGAAGVVEREAVGLVCGGAVGTPWERRAELDLFDLKGVVEALAGTAGVEIEARPAAESTPMRGLLPGASAELWIGDRRAGTLGRLADGGGEPFPLYLAELELAALEADPEVLRAARQVEAPPRLPGIAADLTLTHPLEVPWAEIAGAIRREAAPELRDFRLKVRYIGEGVPEGAVNTTVTFLYHGGERQLTQEEVNGRQAALAGVLVERFGSRPTASAASGEPARDRSAE
jgi:phenylalanyl-tRNA synthetase beta chain